MKELEEARQVLLKESKSIEKASHHIDEKFIKALDILAGSKNKIIFCGIGKSGHIGKKLSATFCSVGSTASFLHASEAVHW
jgi:arabinose-5-phosphate isomerase